MAGGVLLTGAVTALSGKIAFHMEANSSQGTPNTTDDIPAISDARFAVRITAPDGCLTTILSGGVSVLPNHFEGIA